MLDAIREMSENLAEMGFALAGKALSGVFAVVRDVAIKVEEHTGIPVPFAHSGMPVVVESEESVPPWQKESVAGKVPGDGDRAQAHDAKVESAVEPATAPMKDAAKGAESAVKKTEPAQKRPAAKKKTASKSASKSPTRKTGRRKSSAKSGKGKKTPAKNSQVLRLLTILSRDKDSWMSAVELSAATADQGSRILPGNVRKAIRLRAEGLIVSRTRPGSKRGATEYRITEKGLAYLAEHK